MGTCLSKQADTNAPAVVVVQARATRSQVMQELRVIKRCAPKFRVVKCKTWHEAKSILRREFTVKAQMSNGDEPEQRKMVVLHVVSQPTGVLRKIAHACGMCCCTFTMRRKDPRKTCVINVQMDEGVEKLDAFVEHIKSKVAAKGTAIALEASSRTSVVKKVLQLPKADSTLHAENFYADAHAVLAKRRADVTPVGMTLGDSDFTSDSNYTGRAEDSTASHDETKSDASRSETSQPRALPDRAVDQTLRIDAMGLPLEKLASIGSEKRKRLNAAGVQTIEDLSEFDVTDKKLCVRVTKNKREDRAVETVKKWKKGAQKYLEREEIRELENLFHVDGSRR